MSEARDYKVTYINSAGDSVDAIVRGVRKITYNSLQPNERTLWADIMWREELAYFKHVISILPVEGKDA